jgi:small subunit ribosomal protein S1
MSEQVKSQEEFLANFNWHNLIEGRKEKNLLEFEELVSKTFIAQEEVVDGTC